MAKKRQEKQEVWPPIKDPIQNEKKVDVSPTGTISATGEIAQGALGTFSFDEIIGRDAVARHHDYTRRH